jgi:hypothetical protein
MHFCLPNIINTMYIQQMTVHLFKMF